jgi:hypothetical protein
MSFILIDLLTQAKAVKAYTVGWEQDSIINWLKTHGKVNEVHLALPWGDELLYVFESAIGIRTTFRFMDNGQMVIMLEHSTYVL